MEDRRELLSVAESLAYLAQLGRPRTRTALMRRVRDGRLPAQKVGEQWVVRRADLDALASILSPSPRR